MPKAKPCKDHLGNKFLSVKDMCRYYFTYPSLYRNRMRAGWSTEDALTTIKNLKVTDNLKILKPIDDTHYKCEHYNKNIIMTRDQIHLIIQKNTRKYKNLKRRTHMKITDITTLFVGYSKSDNFRILINAENQEIAQELANEYANDSNLDNMTVSELTDNDLSKCFDCDYVITETDETTNTTNETWFVISTQEGSVDYKPYKSYKSAYDAMKKEYEYCSFDPNDYDGEGICEIDDYTAYVDSPEDGYQRHWAIINASELETDWKKKFSKKR